MKKLIFVLIAAVTLVSCSKSSSVDTTELFKHRDQSQFPKSDTIIIAPIGGFKK